MTNDLGDFGRVILSEMKPISISPLYKNHILFSSEPFDELLSRIIISTKIEITVSGKYPSFFAGILNAQPSVRDATYQEKTNERSWNQVSLVNIPNTTTTYDTDRNTKNRSRNQENKKYAQSGDWNYLLQQIKIRAIIQNQ